MAVVRGVKEKVHLPIYDSLTVEPESQLKDAEPTSTLKFFVDVQNKTKLETNLQSAGLLPHYNTFEARALRVVISDLPPQFSPESKGELDDLDVTTADPNDPSKDIPVKVDPATGKPSTATAAVTVTAKIELGLDRIVELLRDAQDSNDGTTDISVLEDGVELGATGLNAGVQVDADAVDKVGGTITVTVGDLQDMLDQVPTDQQPLDEQVSGDGAGTLVNKLIYNTVTTLYVGEKIMIQMPTWFFPSGAGAYSEGTTFVTHGEPNPMATFRFAEPIFIDRQQNFRVEIDVPSKDVLDELQRIYGPMFIWVVLDGYMTRDVQ
jgi:hypothetical protein